MRSVASRFGARGSMMAVLAAGALVAGCVGSGEVPASVSAQIVGDDEKPLGPALVMVEKGKIHEGVYQFGQNIGMDGRFGVELTEGGTWGIHLFHSDYTYLPIEITIADHQQVALSSLNVAWGNWMDLTGQPTWPDQPEDSSLIRMPIDDNLDDNPVISNIQMTYMGGDLMEITADVFDPNGDLSRMILAHDPATGGGYALNPPSPPDEKGNFPDGTYSLKVFLDERHRPGETVWTFVVSDNLCNNTPIQYVTMPPM